ncbi:unnamed protein product [Choristocarpus tenellus]
MGWGEIFGHRGSKTPRAKRRIEQDWRVEGADARHIICRGPVETRSCLTILKNGPREATGTGTWGESSFLGGALSRCVEPLGRGWTVGASGWSIAGAPTPAKCCCALLVLTALALALGVKTRRRWVRNRPHHRQLATGVRVRDFRSAARAFPALPQLPQGRHIVPWVGQLGRVSSRLQTFPCGVRAVHSPFSRVCTSPQYCVRGVVAGALLPARAYVRSWETLLTPFQELTVGICAACDFMPQASVVLAVEEEGIWGTVLLFQRDFDPTEVLMQYVTNSLGMENASVVEVGALNGVKTFLVWRLPVRMRESTTSVSTGGAMPEAIAYPGEAETASEERQGGNAEMGRGAEDDKAVGTVVLDLETEIALLQQQIGSPTPQNREDAEFMSSFRNMSKVEAILVMLRMGRDLDSALSKCAAEESAEMQRLRREASRAEDLEDKLAKKSLLLRQKEVEASALVSNAGVLAELRNEVLTKDLALKDLTAQLDDLRASEAVAAASHALERDSLVAELAAVKAALESAVVTGSVWRGGKEGEGQGEGFQSLPSGEDVLSEPPEGIEDRASLCSNANSEEEKLTSKPAPMPMTLKYSLPCAAPPFPPSPSTPPTPVGNQTVAERKERVLQMAIPSSQSPMSRLAPVEHGLEMAQDVAVIMETGSWRVRFGVVDLSWDEGGERASLAAAGASEGKGGAGASGGGMLSYFDDFPCCVARPRHESMDLAEVVNGASSLAAPMYREFRDIGLFVGGDAWYCTMEHPDRGLRSKLKLSFPMEQGLPTPDVERLWGHAYRLLKQSPDLAPLVLPYKPTATWEELWPMVWFLFSTLEVPAIRLISEATLAAKAAGVRTGVVVDLGESGVYVSPVFEGCPLTESVRTHKVGGGCLTRYLEYMLLSRANEHFNQLIEPRRMDFARQVKEGSCFVSMDFAGEVRRAGQFRRKTVRVMGDGDVPAKLSGYAVCSPTECYSNGDTPDEPVTVSFTTASGEALLVKVGLEKFHVGELLFQASGTLFIYHIYIYILSWSFFFFDNHCGYLSGVDTCSLSREVPLGDGVDGCAYQFRTGNSES